MADWFTKYKVTAGRLLLVVLTGYAVLNLLWQSIRLYPGIPETDPVTIHEARIAQLRPLLPPSGAVGYVTTVENDRIFAAEKTFTNVEFLAQYVLTQYTLAPGNGSGALVLAGIAAGLCAWTKNEGLLFLLIVTGSLVGTTLYTDGRRLSSA